VPKPVRQPRERTKHSWIAGTLLVLGLFVIAFGALISLARSSPVDEFQGVLTTTVDPLRKTITGDAAVDDTNAPESTLTASFWNAFAMSGMRAAVLQTYENIAHPGTAVVLVYPGLRKEEVAALFGKKLKWTDTEKKEFVLLSPDNSLEKGEGYFYPDTYYIPHASTTPAAVHDEVVARFHDEVLKRYATSTATIVNVELALKIASIIQREAAGKHDMAIVSGVIWNRIFKDMTLDMDATLQYAKGNEKIGWWPRVVSKDKYIDSPYNTYQNGGLPPTPISNPSIAAINAALNPKKTDAIFYLHDRRRRIHTAKTYKQHVANINKFY